VRDTIAELFAIAKVMLGCTAAAATAVQAAYATVVPSPATGGGADGPARLRTSLRRAIARQCLLGRQQQRDAAGAPLVSLLPRFQPDGHHVAPARPWQLSAAAVEHDRFRATLRACIDELPPRHGDVLLLCDVLDFDVVETAAAIGADPRAVRRTLHHARQALRTLLEPHCTAAGVSA